VHGQLALRLAVRASSLNLAAARAAFLLLARRGATRPKNDQDCDADHIRSATGLLTPPTLGILLPVAGAAGTRVFEPDGVICLRSGLPFDGPVQSPGSRKPVALRGAAASIIAGQRNHFPCRRNNPETESTVLPGVASLWRGEFQ